jgi:hypothetical protein
MAVERDITGGRNCCMTVRASIETFLKLAEALGWTVSAAVPA